MEEGHKRGLAATQVQAVVPVSAQPLGYAVCPHLIGTELDGSHQMIQDCRWSLIKAFRIVNTEYLVALVLAEVRISKRHHPRKESHVASFHDVFHHGWHQPQMVIRTGISESVDKVRCRTRNDSGQFHAHGDVIALILSKEQRVKEV